MFHTEKVEGDCCQSFFWWYSQKSVTSVAASLIINKLLTLSNCDMSHQNESNILAQLTAYKPIFKPTTLVQDLGTVQFDVSGGHRVGQFKGQALLFQFPAFRKPQWMRSID